VPREAASASRSPLAALILKRAPSIVRNYGTAEPAASGIPLTNKTSQEYPLAPSSNNARTH